MRALKQLMLLAITLLCIQQISAQKKPFSGTVKDSKGVAIEGATVKIKSSKSGTSTAKDGSFTISASEDDVLEIISIGFKSKNIAIKGNSLNISLEASVEELQEVNKIKNINKTEKLSFILMMLLFFANVHQIQ